MFDHICMDPPQRFRKKMVKVILKLAHVNPPDSPTDMAAKKMVDLVAKGTDGKVVIKIFPNEQLGVEKAALEGVTLGTIDCSLNDAAYLADYVRRDGRSRFPLHVQELGPLRQDAGLRCFPRTGPGHGKRGGHQGDRAFSVRTADALLQQTHFCRSGYAEGVKIRTPGSELAMENARVLGGVPTTISYTEAYMGLKQGVADAAENPFTGIYDMKWYEVTKYLVVTEHVWNNEILSVSAKAWKALTPDQQKVFAEAGLEAAKYRMKIQKELEDQRVEDLRNLGMNVIYPASLESFRNLAKGIEEKYREKYKSVNWGKWHDRVMKLGE